MARYPYREVIELYSTGLSIEKVAYLCGVGMPMIRVVSAAMCAFSWLLSPVYPVLDPAELAGPTNSMMLASSSNLRKCVS